jgi:hypothetical protein
MTLANLLEDAKAGRLTSDDLHRVVAMLREERPGVDHYLLLHIIGRSGDRSQRPLVEKYLHRPEDPMLSRLAVQILCGYWNETERYIDRVIEFVDGVNWDEDDDVRLVAISNGGEYLRAHSHPVLLRRLIDIVRDRNERPIVRTAAYFALSRAVGRDWKELPSAARVLDIETEADRMILQEALHRLGRGA